jgi:hypothetical protein
MSDDRSNIPRVKTKSNSNARESQTDFGDKRKAFIHSRLPDSIRLLADETATSQQRTRGAYVLWAWCSIRRARLGLRQVETIYCSSLALAAGRRALDAQMKAEPSLSEFVSSLQYHHLGFSDLAHWSLNSLTSKQSYAEELNNIAKLADAILRRRKLEMESTSLESAYHDYIGSFKGTADEKGGLITNLTSAWECVNVWGSQMPFIWAAHTAGILFLRPFEHKLFGKNEMIKAADLRLDLFADPAGTPMLDNDRVRHFLGYSRWALTAWFDYPPPRKILNAFGTLEPKIPEWLEPTVLPSRHYKSSFDSA